MDCSGDLAGQTTVGDAEARYLRETPCGLPRTEMGNAHAHSGPVVIAYDGTESGDLAIRESGELLAGRPAIVLVVWKEGLGFELVANPAVEGLPPAPIDVRTAVEIDQANAERAQRAAQHGAELAREAGFDAEAQAVADDVDTPVAETITDFARERDAQAVVVGAHGHGGLSEVVLGSTSRDVVRHAPCPVVVVREH
jgi:nucleotide-binding universal stress UspA family protein